MHLSPTMHGAVHEHRARSVLAGGHTRRTADSEDHAGHVTQHWYRCPTHRRRWPACPPPSPGRARGRSSFDLPGWVRQLRPNRRSARRRGAHDFPSGEPPSLLHDPRERTVLSGRLVSDLLEEVCGEVETVFAFICRSKLLTHRQAKYAAPHRIICRRLQSE